MGLSHYMGRRYDQAIAEYQKALELGPNFTAGHWHAGWAYEQTGRYEEGIAHAQRSVELSGGAPTYVASLGHALAIAGRRAEAREILEQLDEASRTRHVSAYHVAVIHGALGDLDEGFRWLDRALEEQSPWVGFMRVDPSSIRFAPIQDSTRYWKARVSTSNVSQPFVRGGHMRTFGAVLFFAYTLWVGGTTYQAGVATGQATAGTSAGMHESGMEAANPTPLILAIDEGERRVRRFAVSAPRFILKVDPQNGGSNDLTMGYEDLPPGGSIPPHWHKVADEILFVHRGSGVVELGDRQRPVTEGATIFIPKDVRITLRNTGTEPLSIAFFFSKPGFDTFLREMSALEGQPFEPLSEAELRTIRKRHEWHTVYERP